MQTLWLWQQALLKLQWLQFWPGLKQRSYIVSSSGTGTSSTGGGYLSRNRFPDCWRKSKQRCGTPAAAAELRPGAGDLKLIVSPAITLSLLSGMPHPPLSIQLTLHCVNMGGGSGSLCISIFICRAILPVQFHALYSQLAQLRALLVLQI